MASPSFSGQKTAAQRALDIAEIVQTVASSFNLAPYTGDCICDAAEQHAIDGGLVTRGVNKLWRSVIDELLVYSLVDDNAISLPSQLTPHLRIIAARSTFPAKIRRLEIFNCDSEDDFEYQQQGAKYGALCATIALGCAQTLTHICLDKHSLESIGCHLHRSTTQPFRHLRCLEVDINDLGIKGPKSGSSELRGICRFLSCLVCLTKLSVRLNAPSGSRLPADGICQLPCEQLRAICSVPPAHVTQFRLVSYSKLTPGKKELKTIYEHFAPLEDLWIESRLSPIFVKGILPRQISHLSILSVQQMAQDIAEMLMDPEQLTSLNLIPELELLANKAIWQHFSPDEFDISHVQEVIEAVGARGTITDFQENSHKLYQLVEYIATSDEEVAVAQEHALVHEEEDPSEGEAMEVAGPEENSEEEGEQSNASDNEQDDEMEG